MKKVLVLVSVMVLLVHVAPVRASMMCAHDWLAAWRYDNGDGAGWIISPTTLSFGDNDRFWALGGNIGNAGHQSVIGVARCSSTAGTSGQTSTNVVATFGQHCWCRMISPGVGSHWVHASNFAVMGNTCATGCGGGGGSTGSCLMMMSMVGDVRRRVLAF